MKARKFIGVAAALLLLCTASSCSVKKFFLTEATTTAAETVTETAETSAAESSGDISDDTETDASGASGGNPEKATYIEITVSEDKYLYSNREITYDELIQLLDGLNGTTAVKLSDENASRKAYEAITEALEKRGILVEKIER